jgi:hypothetical protein
MKALAVFCLSALLVSACRKESMEKPPEPPSAEVAAHRATIAEWQEKRAQRLKAEDGWLSLIGLFWLNEGDNVISIPSAGSPTVKLVRRGDAVALEPSAQMTIDGKPVANPVELRNDAHEQGPTVVQMGSVRFQVIKRGDRYGLRVKDAQAPTRVGSAAAARIVIEPPMQKPTAPIFFFAFTSGWASRKATSAWASRVNASWVCASRNLPSSARSIGLA